MKINPKEFETAIGALASGYRVMETEQETSLTYLMSQLVQMDYIRPNKSKTVIRDIH
jgi:hypothetical protein